jgi:hypothetical protein
LKLKAALPMGGLLYWFLDLASSLRVMLRIKPGQLFSYYTITHGPINRADGGLDAVTAKSASEAWTLIQQLHANGRTIDVRAHSGHRVSWQEIRDMAAQS